MPRPVSHSQQLVLALTALVVLGGGVAAAANRSAFNAAGVQADSDDQAATLELAPALAVDEPLASVVADPDAAAVSPGAVSQGSGDTQETVRVTVDGTAVEPDTFGDHAVSVDTSSTNTLDGSNNGTDVDVRRSVDTDVSNRHSERNNPDIKVNVGKNDVSGNKNPVTVRPGNVSINFSLPR